MSKRSWEAAGNDEDPNGDDEDEPREAKAAKGTAVPEPALPPSWKMTQSSSSTGSDCWGYGGGWSYDDDSHGWRRYKGRSQQARLNNRRNNAVKAVTDQWRRWYDKAEEHKSNAATLQDHLEKAEEENQQLRSALDDMRPGADQVKTLVQETTELNKRLNLVRSRAISKETELIAENENLKSQLKSQQALRRQEQTMHERRLQEQRELEERRKEKKKIKKEEKEAGFHVQR